MFNNKNNNKMPFILTENSIDFTNADLNEICDFIFDLLNRQRNAAKTTV